MVRSFAKEFSVGTDTIQPGITHVTDRCRAAVDVQSHDRRRHHRKARMFCGHLMDRAVGALNRKLHQILAVVTIANLMSKCFLQNVDGCLRCHFARFRAADSVRYSEDMMLCIGDERVFVHGALFAQAAIRNRSYLDFVRRHWCAHWTASKAMGLSTGRFTFATALASCAFRCENAISIPSMAKLVIKLNPP